MERKRFTYFVWRLSEWMTEKDYRMINNIQFNSSLSHVHHQKSRQKERNPWCSLSRNNIFVEKACPKKYTFYKRIITEAKIAFEMKLFIQVNTIQFYVVHMELFSQYSFGRIFPFWMFFYLIFFESWSKIDVKFCYYGL